MRLTPAGGRLALDLGATKFAYCVSDGSPHPPVTKVLLPRLERADAEFAVITCVLDGDDARFGGVPVLAVAPVLRNGVVASWPNRPYWRGFPLEAATASFLGAPVHTVPDGDAAAVADAGDHEDIYYISLFFGTGVAGGIVTRQAPVRFGPLALELGHIVTDPHGPRCCCGQRGCIQASWVAFREQRLPREAFVTDLARLLRTLSRIFPACTVSIGGRLVGEDRAGAEAMLQDLRLLVGRDAWSPELRLSRSGGNGPLVGALLIAERLGECHGTAAG